MSLLKNAVKKLIGHKTKTVLPFEKYAASGNLTYGQNCKLEALSITINGCKAGYNNIKIGNNCFLSCQILLNSPDAQIIIGDGVFIGPGTTLFCYEKIVFENDIMVSWGCTFIDTNAHSLIAAERIPDVTDYIKGPEHKNWSVVKHAPIYIKSKSWVGFNSIVTKGVTVEEGTVIGCGSVLTKSTEPYGVYGGNPATYIKTTS